jgi:hypothetical protein
VSLASLDDWPLLRLMLAIAVDRRAVRGELVRYVSGTYLPEEGRMLCVFLAPAVESVRDVLSAANLPTAHIGPAIVLPDLDPRHDGRLGSPGIGAIGTFARPEQPAR